MFRLCVYELKLNFSTITISFFLFFLYLISIPLFLGIWQDLLYKFHLGIIWTCIVFSFLSDTYLITDLQDGTFEFYFLSKYPLQVILLTKLITNWFLKIIGILCCYPILAFFYHFIPSAIICVSLVLGTLLFTLICSVTNLLTIGSSLKNKSTTDSNSLQYLATLPILLPLIMLCSYIQTNNSHFLFLIGYLIFFFLIYSIVSLLTLRFILSQ